VKGFHGPIKLRNILLTTDEISPYSLPTVIICSVFLDFIIFIVVLLNVFTILHLCYIFNFVLGIKSLNMFVDDATSVKSELCSLKYKQLSS
jgi:hypothetical protein